MPDAIGIVDNCVQTPEQKAVQYKSLQEWARALGAEFANIKAQNRRAHAQSIRTRYFHRL